MRRGLCPKRPIVPPKKIIFSVALVFSLYLLLELFSYLSFFFIFKTWFSFGDMARERNALLQTSQIAGTDKREDFLSKVIASDKHTVIHPYYGFIGIPHKSANKYGFYGPDVPVVQSFAKDKVVIAILGGSVAAQQGIRSQELVAELRKHSFFKDKKITVLNLAIGAYKQPQQLMVLNDILAHGGHFDIVINIDGFNELFVGYNRNHTKHVSIFFASGWFDRVKGMVSLEIQAIMGEIKIVEEERREYARFFSRFLPAHMVTANLFWKLKDRRFYYKLIKLRSILSKSDNQPGSVDTKHRTIDNRAFTGLPEKYKDLRQFSLDVTKHWARCSTMLHNMVTNQGGHYFHFLQPNIFLFGSKQPTSPKEKEAAAMRWRLKNCIVGYPYLRAAGRRLAEMGINFVDATMLFADTKDPIYTDVCHYNDKGKGMMNKFMAKTIGLTVTSRNKRGSSVPLSRLFDTEEKIFSSDNLKKFSPQPETYNDGYNEKMPP